MRTLMALTVAVLVAAVACTDGDTPDSRLTGAEPAFNDTDANCATELDQLRSALREGRGSVHEPQGHKDVAGLQRKIDGANQKLDEGKVEAAKQKLQDFANVMELRDAEKRKITKEAAESLLEADAAAIACVDDLATGRPPVESVPVCAIAGPVPGRSALLASDRQREAGEPVQGSP